MRAARVDRAAEGSGGSHAGCAGGGSAARLIDIGSITIACALGYLDFPLRRAALAGRASEACRMVCSRRTRHRWHRAEGWWLIDRAMLVIFADVYPSTASSPSAFCRYDGLSWRNRRAAPRYLATDRPRTLRCAMLRFLVRRAVLALLVCLTVLVISFALTRLSGDLAISIAGPNATAQDIEIIRKNYGLDRPLPVQFIDWAVHAAAGDLGRSYLYHALGRRPDQGADADHADPGPHRPGHRAGGVDPARDHRRDARGLGWSTRRSDCSRCSARRCRASGWRWC